MEVVAIKNLKTLSHSQKEEILRMAERYSLDLVNRPISADHPMFGVVRAWMLTDIALQLDPAISLQINSEVVIAVNVASKVIGFMTLSRANDSATACGINYICVDSAHRNQGVMTAMIDSLKPRFTDIALSCFPTLVEAYEKIGFVMCESQGAQVAMRIGDSYNMNVIDPNYLNSQRAVSLEAQRLINELGPKRAVAINDEYDAETKRISKEVTAFVEKRKTAASKTVY
ncbi:GNAT family N-acetyltransferase [Pseudomonas veronii]|uniref:GNAT family N-acetyltransferase n=1 Tax=Pseudomonas veronii TaxID=76761 RepID=UPI000F7CF3D9|nr:GNAT family N-acetyltransferase [Pseudomonas veronii]AZP73761.1 GNAT family N-acetyltransferase [Pseudomonas poae]KAA6183349.1 GNAT family N-acetyltransferase [Pseudomonas veronii]